MKAVQETTLYSSDLTSVPYIVYMQQLWQTVSLSSVTAAV